MLRRVYLDLIGLPRRTNAGAAYAAYEDGDFSATPQAAYEKVVERLLSSKQYGERWGRHWMDIWRYSDWWGLGAEVRNSQKHIWHWRDWIIESLNADKGYDQMLREMLAADELYPTDPDRLRGSGFLARQYFRFNRNTWMEEVVEHTSKAFLGLTMNCSKCHDHKYDPLTQQDFYRFRAFFEPYQVRTDMVPGETDFEKDGLPRAFDCNLEAPTYVFIRGDERQPRKDQAIVPGLPAILGFDKLEINAVALPPEALAPQLRPFVLENALRSAETKIAAAKEALAKARKTSPAPVAGCAASDLTDSANKKRDDGQVTIMAAEKALAVVRLQPDWLRACALADRARLGQPPMPDAINHVHKAALLEKGLALARAEESLAQAELEVLQAAAAKKAAAEQKRTAAAAAVAKATKDVETPGDTYTSLRGSLKTVENNLESEASRSKPFPTTSTGRRTALAQWLTDKHNPLTARVAVNHIWARHFGKPLVATVFDFGRKGAAPTHPELLDYLAVELMEHQWSMKHIHRLIVTSSAYRMSSSAKLSGSMANRNGSDAENRYLWRMNPLRMEAQVIRDSLLSLSGELDLAMGGPPLPVADETSRRRSLYFIHSHNDHQTFLSTFDDASVLECYRRAESIVPQQALTLGNSKLAMTAAEKIAKRIEAKDDAAFIKGAFELLLGSTPTAEEAAECERALKELREIADREKKADGLLRARANLVLALLNHNDFVTIR